MRYRITTTRQAWQRACRFVEVARLSAVSLQRESKKMRRSMLLTSLATHIPGEIACLLELLGASFQSLDKYQCLIPDIYRVRASQHC